MFLGFMTLLFMLFVLYAYLNEDLVTSFSMLCNMFLAGLVTFNFFEPLADLLDPMVHDSVLEGWEDAFCMMAIFIPTFGIFRMITNGLTPIRIEFPTWFQLTGTLFCGCLTTYLAVGLLVCMYQTLPWHENFMYFQAGNDPNSATASLRRYFPPERLWLALMHRAGAYGLSNSGTTTADADTFDKYATFELRYARYRRYPEPDPKEYSREPPKPKPYSGELDPVKPRQGE
jgi:hypothetical protein